VSGVMGRGRGVGWVSGGEEEGARTFAGQVVHHCDAQGRVKYVAARIQTGGRGGDETRLVRTNERMAAPRYLT